MSCACIDYEDLCPSCLKVTLVEAYDRSHCAICGGVCTDDDSDDGAWALHLSNEHVACRIDVDLENFGPGSTKPDGWTDRRFRHEKRRVMARVERNLDWLRAQEAAWKTSIPLDLGDAMLDRSIGRLEAAQTNIIRVDFQTGTRI